MAVSLEALTTIAYDGSGGQLEPDDLEGEKYEGGRDLDSLRKHAESILGRGGEEAGSVTRAHVPPAQAE